MHRIIDLLTSVIIIFIIIYFNLSILKCLGGSIIFLSVCSIIYYVSYTYRKLQLELSILAILSLTLVVINYLSYIEVEKLYHFQYILIGFSILFLITIVCFIIINIRVIKITNDKKSLTSQANKVEIIKKIIGRFAFFPLTSIGFVIPSGFVFIVNPNSEIIKQGWIKYTPLGIFWMLIFFMVTFISLKKINKNYFLFVLNEKNKIKVPNLKKYFTFATILFIILGSGLEIVRGFWFFWIETASLFLIIIVASWQVWKYVFEEHKCDLAEINLEGLKSITDFDFFLKYIGSYILLGTIYLVALAIICS